MERGNEEEGKRVKKRRGFFFALVLSFLAIVILTVSFNRVNRTRINSEFKSLTRAGGETIRELIGASGFHLMEKGGEAVKGFLDELFSNPSILYIGLKHESELIYLLSRYEGYFPVVESEDNIRFISSPVGTVFEVKGDFRGNDSGNYFLFIGFDYDFLTTFEQSSGRYFLFLMGIILAVFILIVLLALRFDRILYRKEIDYIKERDEKERLAELSLLTSEIAHEIKNPLNSIYLSFNSLDRYLESSEEAVFYRDAVKAEIKRISDIINSYSGLSKKIIPKISDVDIKKLVEELRVLKRNELNEKGVTLSTRSDSGMFRTDRDLLIQILLNLINNAVEADAGSISVEISSRGKILTIHVRDDGRGIDPGKLDSIFKPYVSSKSRGMGLGLHIVMKNVKALGGKVELLSGEEGKKDFRVTLKEGDIDER